MVGRALRCPPLPARSAVFLDLTLPKCRFASSMVPQALSRPSRRTRAPGAAFAPADRPAGDGLGEPVADELAERVEQVEVLRPHRGDVGQQRVGPRGTGQRPLDLGVDDRPAVAGVHPRQPRVTDAEIAQLETEMDLMNEDVPPLRSFVLPGASHFDEVATRSPAWKIVLPVIRP